MPNCKPVTWLKSVLVLLTSHIISDRHMRYVSNTLMDINFPLVLMAMYDIFDVFSNEMGLMYTKNI